MIDANGVTVACQDWEFLSRDEKARYPAKERAAAMMMRFNIKVKRIAEEPCDDLTKENEGGQGQGEASQQGRKRNG